MSVEKNLQIVLDAFISEFKLQSIADDIYIAGGAIRDLVNSRIPKDFDIYFTNVNSANLARKSIGTGYLNSMNNNGNLDTCLKGFRINVIFNSEFCLPPQQLISEFNFHQNMNFYHKGQLYRDGSIYDLALVLNQKAKYPLGIITKLPRMIELGYKIREIDMLFLLGKVVSLGIKTQEEFLANCPNISGGFAARMTGLPTAKELFDKSELGQALS